MTTPKIEMPEYEDQKNYFIQQNITEENTYQEHCVQSFEKPSSGRTIYYDFFDFYWEPEDSVLRNASHQYRLELFKLLKLLSLEEKLVSSNFTMLHKLIIERAHRSLTTFLFYRIRETYHDLGREHTETEFNYLQEFLIDYLYFMADSFRKFSVLLSFFAENSEYIKIHRTTPKIKKPEYEDQKNYFIQENITDEKTYREHFVNNVTTVSKDFDFYDFYWEPEDSVLRNASHQYRLQFLKLLKFLSLEKELVSSNFTVLHRVIIKEAHQSMTFGFVFSGYEVHSSLEDEHTETELNHLQKFLADYLAFMASSFRKFRKSLQKHESLQNS